jgi:hypothetical protein
MQRDQKCILNIYSIFEKIPIGDVLLRGDAR